MPCMNVRPRRSLQRLAAAGILALGAATLPATLQATGSGATAAGAAPGLRGARLWSNPDTAAVRAARRTATTNAADARLLAKVAGSPQGTWVTSGTPASRVADRVRAVTRAASAAGAVPVLTLYGLPHLDCRSAGAPSASAYRAWIGQVVAGLGDRPAAVVVEPDALALLSCLAPADRQQRLDLLAAAVHALRADPAAAVYLDAGHSSWVSSTSMAKRLTAAGIGEARGFALNVSNFRATTDEVAYGHRISAKLGRRTPFVVDTGRNGLGPAADAGWCNPGGRALGERPTTTPADPLVDALLWIKPPGESDGFCGGHGAPAAGAFWTGYAEGLAARAAW